MKKSPTNPVRFKQYKALMENGVSVAKQMDLRVGIALSPEQIANLTTDIVWLVEQEVMLANGQKQKVLAPQVYVRLQKGDLNQSGSILAGQNTSLNIIGDLKNSGTIAGREALIIKTNEIQNFGGNIKANQLSIDAKRDINIIGGRIEAKDKLLLNAGRNVNIESTVNTTNNIQGINTHVNRQAGVYLTGTESNSLLSIQAGQDILLKAGTIENKATQGLTQLDAKNKIQLDTVEIGREQNNIANAENYIKRTEKTELGSRIDVKNNALLKAGQDVSLKASEINSETGTIQVQAENIKLESGTVSKTADDALKTKSRGFASTTTNTFKDKSDNTEALSSSLTAKNVLLDARKDISVKGSNIVSDEQTFIKAGGNVRIEGAENQYLNSSEKTTKKSGLMSSGGIGVTLGQKRESTDQSNREISNKASMVGSLKGDTTIIAGEKYQQIGSTVSAKEGDVNILAKKVDIEAALDKNNNDYKHETVQKGLTLAVNVPIVSTVETAQDSIKTVGKSKNSRVNAMAAANAGMDSVQAAQSLAKLNQAATKGVDALKEAQEISATLTYGQQKNTQQSHRQQTTANRSQVYAGGKTNIVATGAGEQSDINIQGSNVMGMQGTRLVAEHDVNIKATEQNSTEHSSNNSKGWNAGVSVSSKTGWGVTAGGNLGKGQGNGTETTYANSYVGSKDSRTEIISANATNIKGGQVLGKGVQVTAKELNIESLQDRMVYDSQQKDMSAQVSVGLGTGTGSVSANYGQSKIKANHVSVNEQSGIFTGDDGFQINVQNNTDLKGGLITSTQQALKNQKNKFETGTLSYTNLQNVSEYDAKGFSVGAGLNIGGKEKPKTEENTPNTVLAGPGKIDEPASRVKGLSKSIGFGQDDDKQSSTTYSGINSSNLIIRETKAQQALTGKTAEQVKSEIQTTVTTETVRENSGALKNVFDKDQVQSEINLQMQVTKKFGENAPKAVADYAANRANNLRAEGREQVAQKWDEGGIYRVAAHAALGALMGGDITSTLAAGTTAASAPTLNKIQESVQSSLQANGLSKEVAEGLSGFVTTVAAFGIGNTIGGNTSTGSISANIDMNNRQLHVDEIGMLKKEAAKLASQNGQMNQDNYEYWFTLLYSVAYGKVDTNGREQLMDMAKQWDQAGKATNDFSLKKLSENISFASKIVDSMAGKTLTDNNANPIIENGAVVKTFQATEAQKNNTSLFGYNSKTVGLKSKDDPKGYGSSGISNKLAQGTVQREHEDIVEGLERGSKGIVPVYPEMELIGTGKLAKETAKHILEKQTAKKAEQEEITKQILHNNVYRDSTSLQVIEQTYQKGALSSTHNSTSKEVILGKYIKDDPNSYEAIARSRNATYFSMSDWEVVSAQLGANNMWNVNKAFLDQQIKAEKKFIFTADPRKAETGYFTKLEYQHLIKNGYKLEASKGGFYNAVKK